MSRQQQLIDMLRQGSFQYVLTIGDHPAQHADKTWISLADMATSDVVERLVADFADSYSTGRRQAGSLVFQRAMHRLIGAIVGAWLLNFPVLRFRPEETYLLVKQGATSALHVTTDELAWPDRQSWDEQLLSNTDSAFLRDAGIGSEDLVTAPELMEFIELRVAPVIEACVAASGVGRENLWGNVAAALGGTSRNLCRKGLIENNKAATALLQAHQRTANKGWFEAGQFYRNSCCHWHTTGNDNCDWCALRRTARYNANN